ncbi:hypothetical protein JXA84_03460 [candidate division WOR-3 bacterium]|nr:hypothetical protein [candidate division WOR-3 bacterium]
MLSTVNRLIALFQDSLKELGIEIQDSKVEKLAFLVHSAMTGQNRNFHTPEHVFQICDGMKPVQILAGLFHDIVYYQIDQGFPVVLKDTLTEFVDADEREILIKKKIKDENVKMVLEVFGFEYGQRLSVMNGMNEFLSALSAVKQLENILPQKHLLAISACIEGTIPFRKKSDGDKSCFEKLNERIIVVNQKYKFNLSDEEISEILQMSVEMGNKDVENFAYEDVAKFLDCTWELLPETNPILWAHSIYSIKNYRSALMKMELFMENVDPLSIFHNYSGFPDDEKFGKMSNQAMRNVSIAREYLGVKLLSTGIIEALASSTGGDAPISMFLGDVKQFGYNDEGRAEHYLPEALLQENLKYNYIVLSLLETERPSENIFDMRNSPFSSFIYKKLGKEKCEKNLNLAKLMFKGDINPENFLEKIEAEIVTAFAKSCSEIAITRKEKLKAFF